MPYFDRDGIDLYWLERGRGRPVVLLHGLGSCGGDSAFQVPALQDEFRTILPDLRGSGRSAHPPGPYSIAGFADDTWALLDHLGVRDADVVGFSLGGAVALEMALQRPAHVPRLVTINSLACYHVDGFRKWAELTIQSWVVRLGGMERAARLVAERVFPEPYQAAMRERAARVIGATPVSPYLDSVRALAGWCATDRLGSLASRTLMIAAEFDYTPLGEKRELAAQVGAEFVVVRGSRHGTPFDAIEATNACLSAFLSDRPLPPPTACRIDAPERVPTAPPPGSVAEEHAQPSAEESGPLSDRITPVRGPARAG
jgi:pimeloyl-ACP methyl ester carboxylesterase